MKRAALIVIVAVFCFAGLAGAASAEKVLTVAQVADVSTLDPHKANDVYSANVMKQIYNNLVKINDEIEIEADLAESWENPDEKTWIFHLRKGVKFHNGDELTASDVVFSIERLMSPEMSAPGAYLLQEVDHAVAEDKYTVKIVTKNPFAPLLSSLARYEMAILNEKTVEAAGEDYAKNPVGTGPFMFESRHYGDRVVLKKFPDYFEGAAKVDQVVYRAIPEDATRVIELESGGIDIMYNLPPQEYERLSGAENLQIYETVGQSTLYIGMDLTHPPFDNQKVRLAMNYAVDKQAIIDAVFFGKADPSYGPISPSIWGFDRSLEPVYPYNPEKAAELLKEAGFGNGFDCELWTDPRTERKSVCEIVQAYLSQIGINAEIKTMEWGSFLNATKKGSKALFVLGYTGTGDADGGLFPRFHSSAIQASNRDFYSDEETDALLEKGRTTVDIAARQQVYKELQAKLIEEAPNIFIAVPKFMSASRENVVGFVQYPNNINPLYGVDIAQ
ncbi:MAG: ABC transporter substrate-binding protein [Thermovirgaceae bacterium]